MTELLAQYGALGIVCGLAILDISYLQKQLFSVVNNNTKAMIELQKTIEHYHSGSESR